MNKLLLALIILGAGTLASTRLNLLANQSRTSTARSRSARSLLASQVNELAVVAAALRTQVEAKRTRLNEVSEAVASERGAASTFNSDSVWDRQRATPSQLRRRFGIVWTNSPDYVLVSKATLKGVNGFLCDGLDGDGALMPIACTVLSVTAAERNAIQAALMRAKADHAVWIKTAVQRVEPVGDILADYRIPANPKVAQRLQGEVSLVLTEALGPERSEFVHQYVREWIKNYGSLGERDVTFSVSRRADSRGSPYLRYDSGVQDVGGSSGGLAHFVPFPELFRGVFPGGWRDVAQREGFALPKDFQ